MCIRDYQGNINQWYHNFFNKKGHPSSFSSLISLEFTGSIAAAPYAVKNLNVLMGSNCDEVLINCITVLHSLVQQDGM